MCIINDITHFVKNGFTVLRHASSGNYEENLPEIEALKREMFWLYRYCPWIAHTNLLAKYHRATVQEERQVTYTPKFGSEAFHL